MKRFKGVKGAIILIVLIAGMVGFYFYLNHKTQVTPEEDAQMDAITDVLSRDLAYNYPPTPKEVVKYYGDLTLCIYSGTCSDTDLDRLAKQQLLLYDDDLVSNNPWNEYIFRLREDVHDYNENNRMISSFIPAGYSSVDYFQDNGYDWSRINCTFYRKQENQSDSVNEIFLLRKDTSGKWKIYGWDLASNVNLKEAEAN